MLQFGGIDDWHLINIYIIIFIDLVTVQIARGGPFH